MNKEKLNLLLADDDADDCAFFQEAVEDLSLQADFTSINDGVHLMKYLYEIIDTNYPDILFLDLNMPRKSGFECLSEIKSSNKLKHIPIIIFSTSLNLNIVDLLYDKGAMFYIQKPGDFSKLRNVLFEAITTTTQSNFQQPPRENFILQP